MAHLEPATADQFDFQAQRIITAINNDSANEHALVKMYSKDGMPCLEFTGDTDRKFIVEASTDLVHWENIGQAEPTGNGNFEFLDKRSDNFSGRYYRIIAQ